MPVVFWLCIVLSVLVALASIACVSDDAMKTNDQVKSIFICLVMFFALVLRAGTALSVSNSSFAVVTKIVQKSDGYIIYAEPQMKIYQKECTYKVKDTLWIKR
jgi:hypothetical protein